MKNNFKKAWLSALLGAILVLSYALPVFAAPEPDAKVVFRGDPMGFILYPQDKDLFIDFKDLMPGDNLTQKILLRNNGDDEASIYLRMKVADQEVTTPEELALIEDLLFDTDLLKITINAGDRVVYSDAAGGTTRPFEAVNGYTTASIPLRSLYGNGYSAVIDVKLEVSSDLGNDYKDLIAKVDWEFNGTITSSGSPNDSLRPKGYPSGGINNTLKEKDEDKENSTPLVDPTNPTDTNNSTEINNPTDTNNPTEINNPTDISNPTEINNPTDTSNPTEINNPTDTSNPVDSANYSNLASESLQNTPSVVAPLAHFPNEQAPRTGDDSPIFWYSILALVSLGVVLSLFIAKRKGNAN